MNNSETLLYGRSTHWIKYLQKTLFYSLIGIFGICLMLIAGHLFPRTSLLAIPIFLIGFILFLLCHHLIFHLYLSEQLIDILITDKRIVYFNDCLFTCDDEHEIPLRKIAAVEVQQHGLVANVLNYGVLWFDTGGGSVDIRRSIPNVPNPDAVADIINRAISTGER